MTNPNNRTQAADRTKAYASSAHREPPSHAPNVPAPTLMALQQLQREILELLAEMRAKPAPVPVALIVEPVFN